MAVDEEKKANMAHYEQKMDALPSEYEPPEDYRVHWRTLAAIVALAMGNVCAAMSNTVSVWASWHMLSPPKVTYARNVGY